MKPTATAPDPLIWPPATAAPETPRPASLLRRTGQFWQTVRHLTPRQIFYQVRRRVCPPSLLVCPDRVPEVQAVRGLELQPFAGRDPVRLDDGRFCFLNRSVDLGHPIDWEARGLPRLWRYHLHYFDCLGQPDLCPAAGWMLVRDWITRHRPLRSAVGWEPYPLSLRAVNWLKFLHEQREYPDDVVRSLALQGANLERQIEHHLQGNHLLANGKALWWLGVMLDHEGWRRTGRGIVLSQLPEQFLPDGGHFELSPMYHALTLEDLLDLANLARGAGDAGAFSVLEARAARALAWLVAIADDSGRIPLLNDSAHGMARTPSTLCAYAARLGIAPDERALPDRALGTGGWTGRDLSGYRVLRHGRMRLLFDTAALGPDHLPGHAHGDLLSVLLDFDGLPIFTDTGVFEYSEGPHRDHSRGTSAHNTIQLDGLDQADLWKSFRMGRRARPGGVRVEGNEIRCAHNGFARRRPGLGHERILRLEPGGFTIVDELSGPAEHRFESRFHVAPGIGIEERDGHWWIDRRLRLTIRGAQARIVTSPYYPEFGRMLERPCLTLAGSFQRNARIELQCTSSF